VFSPLERKLRSRLALGVEVPDACGEPLAPFPFKNSALNADLNYLQVVLTFQSKMINKVLVVV
jgi:hypothetical protein